MEYLKLHTLLEELKLGGCTEDQVIDQLKMFSYESLMGSPI